MDALDLSEAILHLCRDKKLKKLITEIDLPSRNLSSDDMQVY